MNLISMRETSSFRFCFPRDQTATYVSRRGRNHDRWLGGSRMVSTESWILRHAEDAVWKFSVETEPVIMKEKKERDERPFVSLPTDFGLRLQAKGEQLEGNSHSIRSENVPPKSETGTGRTREEIPRYSPPPWPSRVFLECTALAKAAAFI